MKVGLSGFGYAFVILCVDRQRKQKYIHRLVAEAFVFGYFADAEVNHKNGIKTNNVVWNLEWCSRSENLRHAYKTGLNPGHPKTQIRIVETGEVFASMSDCARYTGGHCGVISNCLRGKQITHKGFTFEYVN